MRIGCLQFAPAVGDVDNNLNRADAVLNRADPKDLDLLVLPELAFSGYNFHSLRDIAPFLEYSGSGISSLWARTVALKYDCTVIVGYPEKIDPARKWPTDPEYYNAAIVVSSDGETVANYRKTHLFRTDETWALENPRGFYKGYLVGLGYTAIGICMDLNPYRFEAPWNAYEFAFHVVEMRANLVVLSMAWMTAEDGRKFSRMPQEPDMETLLYWVTRLEPVIRNEQSEEVIVVFANRTGVEEDAIYAGTSAVMGVKDGEVSVYGILGRGVKELLVVDTDAPPMGKLVYRPDGQVIGLDGPGISFTKETSNPDDSQTSSRDDGYKESSASDGDRSKSSSSDQGSYAGSSKRSPPRPSHHSSRTIAREKKLTLQTQLPANTVLQPTSPEIQTPTCPSPTPISLRPRLGVPPAEAITTHYIESQLPLKQPGSMLPHMGSVSVNFVETHIVNSQPLFKNSSEVQVLGGHVRVPDGASINTSPSQYRMSQFSDISPESPKFFWIPSSRLLETPFNARGPTPGAASDVTTFSETGSIIARSNANSTLPNRYYLVGNQEKRLSFRSSDPTGEEAPAASAPKSDGMDQAGSKPSPEDGSTPGRPASPKSRNASRSRGPEQPGSSLDSSTNLDAIAQKLGEIAQRVVETGQGRSSSEAPRSEQAPSPWKPGSHAAVRALDLDRSLSSSQPSLRTVSTSHLRDASVESFHQSPPRANRQTGQSPALRQRATSATKRGRHGERSDSTGGRGTPLTGDSGRTVSRGRQPAPENSSTPSRPAPRAGRRSSNRSRHAESVEPIDLSQFRLIEEHISPDCPLHGPRSQSSLQHGNSTPQGKSTPQRNNRSNQRNDSRDHTPLRRRGSSQNVSSPPGRANTSDPVLAHSGTASRTAPDKSRVNKKGSSTVNVSVKSVAERSMSPKSTFEPKTPEAMTLVFDTATAAIQELGLTCIEKPAAVQIGRPKSAVW